MSWLEPVRRSAEEFVESLGEGWDWLRRRASTALTRFHPTDSAAPQTVRGMSTPAWGLLAGSVAETDEEVVFKIEVPGMQPGDFSIQVDDGVLAVRGEKRVDQEEKTARYHLVEVAYGRFERRIPLPCAVDADAARAHYERGVLTVRLPRAEHERRRQIPVRSA